MKTSGLYFPKVGDRVQLIRRPGYLGTVKSYQVEDHLHSGSVMVLWDGSSEPTRQHSRFLEKRGVK
jgi:hypothetical protein